MRAMSDVEFEVAAGPFGKWLQDMRASLRGTAGTDVPCGDCVGCCVSSYFIPVRFADKAAREWIPPQLLVRTSGMPEGDRLMGYREDGTCPMLDTDRRCTIYEHRPQTCRDYDCRIFAAAGIDAGGSDKHVINRRVRAWRFTYASEEDRLTHEAVRNAASFIQERRNSFPGGRAPTAPTGIAVLAVKAYGVFLDPGLHDKSDEEIAMAIIKASGAFDAGE